MTASRLAWVLLAALLLGTLTTNTAYAADADVCETTHYHDRDKAVCGRAWALPHLRERERASVYCACLYGDTWDYVRDPDPEPVDLHALMRRLRGNGWQLALVVDLLRHRAQPKVWAAHGSYLQPARSALDDLAQRSADAIHAWEAGNWYRAMGRWIGQDSPEATEARAWLHSLASGPTTRPSELSVDAYHGASGTDSALPETLPARDWAAVLFVLPPGAIPEVVTGKDRALRTAYPLYFIEAAETEDGLSTPALQVWLAAVRRTESYMVRVRDEARWGKIAYTSASVAGGHDALFNLRELRDGCINAQIAAPTGSQLLIDGQPAEGMGVVRVPVLGNPGGMPRGPQDLQVMTRTVLGLSEDGRLRWRSQLQRTLSATGFAARGNKCVSVVADISEAKSMVLLGLPRTATCTELGVNHEAVREAARNTLAHAKTLRDRGVGLADFVGMATVVGSLGDLEKALRRGQPTGADRAGAALEQAASSAAAELWRQGARAVVGVELECNRGPTHTRFTVVARKLDLDVFMRGRRDMVTGTELSGLIEARTEVVEQVDRLERATRRVVSRLLEQEYLSVSAPPTAARLHRTINVTVEVRQAREEPSLVQERLRLDAYELSYGQAEALCRSLPRSGRRQGTPVDLDQLGHKKLAVGLRRWHVPDEPDAIDRRGPPVGADSADDAMVVGAAPSAKTTDGCNPWQEFPTGVDASEKWGVRARAWWKQRKARAQARRNIRRRCRGKPVIVRHPPLHQDRASTLGERGAAAEATAQPGVQPDLGWAFEVWPRRPGAILVRARLYDEPAGIGHNHASKRLFQRMSPYQGHPASDELVDEAYACVRVAPERYEVWVDGAFGLGRRTLNETVRNARDVASTNSQLPARVRVGLLRNSPTRYPVSLAMAAAVGFANVPNSAGTLPHWDDVLPGEEDLPAQVPSELTWTRRSALFDFMGGFSSYGCRWRTWGCRRAFRHLQWRLLAGFELDVGTIDAREIPKSATVFRGGRMGNTLGDVDVGVLLSASVSYRLTTDVSVGLVGGLLLSAVDDLRIDRDSAILRRIDYDGARTFFVGLRGGYLR